LKIYFVEIAYWVGFEFFLSVSNNWCIGVTRCFANWYHFPLECLVDDVIATYKKLAY
jgi:hypothetical protein